MKAQKQILLLLLILISVLSFNSCKDDEVSTNPSYQLAFSENTLTFDTVFTTIGSTTASILVYNNNKEALNISSIHLAEGASSPFKINVSGKNSLDHSFENTYIRGKDSLFIFVQVTVDPTLQNTPLLIEDSIVFKVNGNTQYLTLQAYGQDVIILKDKFILNDTTLLNTKPYLIFGDLSIGPSKTLTIEKGSTLHFHNNAALKVHGNLNAIGTLNEPITFRGDRIDNIFKDTPYDAYSGQWDGLIFTAETGIHVLEHVNIRNAKTGIDIECGDLVMPKLSIKNSIIHNFDSCGIKAKKADLEIVNSQISNTGQYCIKIQGGNFKLSHCTLANYFSKIKRSTPSVYITNHEDEGQSLLPITQGTIKNCIIHGNRDDELTLDYKYDNTPVATDFNVTISNSLINSDSSADTYYSNILWSNSSELIFEETEEYPYNFALHQDSPAKNSADMITAALYPTDKNDTNRLIDGQADMGAYEWVTP